MTNPIIHYIQLAENHVERIWHQVFSFGAENFFRQTEPRPQYHIRPLKPCDCSPLFELHQRLSKETLYLRYLTPRQPTRREVESICSLSASQGAAFVVQPPGDESRIAGLAYYRFDETNPHSPPEFAIVVEDLYQGQGMGTELVKHLCCHAASAGIEILKAFIEIRNSRMRHMLRLTGYPFDEQIDRDTVEATIYTQSHRPPAGGMFLGRHKMTGVYDRLDVFDSHLIQ